MKYRNRIQEPGKTISGLADSKKKTINADRPTLDFLTCDSKHTYFFWPKQQPSLTHSFLKPHSYWNKMY